MGNHAMKALIWLFLLLNLGLLVYFNLDVIAPSTPKIQWAEIEPDKINLLSEADIKTLPKKASTTEKTAIAAPAVQDLSACFEWGVFSESTVEKAKNAAISLSLKPTVKDQQNQAAKRFWVFIPPLASTEEAQKIAEELKILGIEDLFVVQEPKWRNAISFGLFEEEQLATALLDELKAKNVQNVEKSLWQQDKAQSNLLFTQLSAAEVTKLETLKAKFPEARLNKISCE